MRIKARRINESKIIVRCCMVVVFIVMLVLNILTVMVRDDYLYAFSFDTHERITDIMQIFSSMYRHYYTMNGRLILHSLVQVFSLAPAIVFDVVNALMFCALVALMYDYSCYRLLKKHNSLVLTCLTAMLWKFTPAFGQVYLWQDCAVNYLWPAVFVLLYLRPLIGVYDGDETMKVPWKRILWVLGGFPVGALSESFSMAVMVAVFLMIVFMRVVQKRKIKIWMAAGLLFCMVGYLIMNLSPGTWNFKLESEKGIAASFLDVLDQYTSSFLWLLVLWIVLLVAALYLQRNARAVCFSCLFMAMSFFVNFLHVFASSYPLRSMTAVTVFLIMADISLLSLFWDGKYEAAVSMVCALSVCFAAVEFFPGAYDILTVSRDCSAVESYILEERDKGNLDIQVPIISGKTKYSALYNLKSLTKSSDNWCNVYIAKYYGLNSITGVRQ